MMCPLMDKACCKEQCAWWNETEGECAMLSASYYLSAHVMQLGELVEIMKENDR